MPPVHRPPNAPDQPGTTPRTANLRTALILLSIALVFFAGVIVSQYVGGSAVGIGVLGFAIIGFLLAVATRQRAQKGAQTSERTTRAEPRPDRGFGGAGTGRGRARIP